jgi:hypothetical protein
MITTGSVVGLAVAVTRMWFGSREHGAVEQSRGGPADPDLSFARYQVMERLLSPRDLQFLASLPGKPARNWKRESLRIFRVYLDELTNDFQALHGHARRMVAESHTESPELAAALVRQQVVFFRARLALEVRLLLFALGWGSVEVAPLLQMVEAMRLDLGRLVPEAVDPLTTTF